MPLVEQIRRKVVAQRAVAIFSVNCSYSSVFLRMMEASASATSAPSYMPTWRHRLELLNVNTFART